jgi:hypothetical protein
MMSAKKKWRKISGPNRLPEVILGVEFKDGIKQLAKRRLMRAVTNFWAYLAPRPYRQNVRAAALVTLGSKLSRCIMKQGPLTFSSLHFYKFGPLVNVASALYHHAVLCD